jgi:hypothetical protein
MERWERELEALRGLRLSGRARARVDDGPKGDGMPPAPARGQRVLAGVVAFAIFGAAIALAAGAFDRDDSSLGTGDVEPAVLTLIAGNKSPEMTLEYEGAKAGSREDGRCWNQADGPEQCADTFGEHEPFLDDEFLRIPEGTPFLIVNPDGADPVRFFLEQGGAPADQGPLPEVQVDDLALQPPGRYSLLVSATWDGRGDNVGVHFAIEIVPASTGLEPTVLLLAAHDSGPEMRWTFGGEVAGQYCESFSWREGGGTSINDCFLDSFSRADFLEIPQGRDLRIDNVNGADPVDMWMMDAADWLGASPGPGEPLSSDGFSMLPAGRYVFTVQATWSQGAVTNHFAVEITPDAIATPSGLVATLDAPDDGSMPQLGLAFSEVAMTYPAQGGEWPGVDGFDEPLHSFPALLPAGTELSVVGDATVVEASTQLVGEHGDLTGDPVTLDVSAGSATLPPNTGAYELRIEGTWDAGTATFFVRIEVGEDLAPPANEPPALEALLDAPDDGSMPALTLSYLRHSDEYFAQGGHWPGVDGFVAPLLSFREPLQPGTPLRVEGDADEVQVRVVQRRSDGRDGEETEVELEAGLGFLPEEVGVYQLIITGTWPRGTASFFVDVQIGEPEVVEPSPLPESEPGIVPDVVGVGEGDAYKVLSGAGLEGVSTYEPTPDVAAGLVVAIDPPPGTQVPPGTVVQLIVSGTSTALDGYLAGLACAQENMMPFADQAGDEPAGELYIRLNVEGIRQSDELERLTGDDPVGYGLWEVIRGDDVVAVIDFESLDGIACRGSGIGGV